MTIFRFSTKIDENFQEYNCVIECPIEYKAMIQRKLLSLAENGKVPIQGSI